MGIEGLLFLMLIVGILSGLGRWATKQRYDRKFQERLKEMEECCGESCCEHENKKSR